MVSGDGFRARSAVRYDFLHGVGAEIDLLELVVAVAVGRGRGDDRAVGVEQIDDDAAGAAGAVEAVETVESRPGVAGRR